jgi:ubiquinone/menaquinone biosynthesis C-methylase UbiE
VNKADYHSSKFQQHFYDRLSETKADEGGLFSCGYEERYNPRLIIDNEEAFNIFYDLFSPLFSDGTPRVILDMCSGSGIHLPLLSQFSKTVVGVDLSFGLLNRAYELTRELKMDNAFLVQSLAETVALRDDSCDAVIMIDGIHHVEDQEEMMKELQRVARADAPFMLIEPNISNPLVYLAHRIPQEERGALRRNTSRRLTALLSPYVTDIVIKPFNKVASNKKTPFARAAVRVTEWAFTHVFFFWPVRLLIQGRFYK